MIEFLLKYKELIIIFSGIGTFISALIAIFTLNEVKKQRLSLYQPDILIKSFVVSISKNPFLLGKDELIEYKVSNWNDYSNKDCQKEYEVYPRYKVENLGLGIAKNIKCEWQFDTKKAIKLIEELLPDNYLLIYNKPTHYYFFKNVNDDEFQCSIQEEIDQQNIDYISPINIQEHNHFHSIPEVIILNHYLFLMFKNNLIEKEAANFYLFDFKDLKFPKPILKVEYRDINNKKYQVEYKFRITAGVTQIDEVLDLTKEFACLQFELE